LSRVYYLTSLYTTPGQSRAVVGSVLSKIIIFNPESCHTVWTQHDLVKDDILLHTLPGVNYAQRHIASVII